MRSHTMNPDEAPLGCHVIRYLASNKCVIRLKDTGAVLPITLNTPFNDSRAALISAITPVEAKVKLGPYHIEWFLDCELSDIQWAPCHTYPPPRMHRKRRRDEEPEETVYT